MTPEQLEVLATEFERETNRPRAEALLFARQVASLARELPATQAVKDRRRRARKAFTALNNAADALAALDGVTLRCIVDQCGYEVTRDGFRECPHPVGSEEYARHVYAERDRTTRARITHPPIGKGHYAFGRRGLPERPVRPSQDRSPETLAGMVADLKLLALGAGHAAKGELQGGPDLDSLADAMVQTLAAFGVRAVGTADRLAAKCMEEVLAARGDGGSGLAALRDAIKRESRRARTNA